MSAIVRPLRHSRIPRALSRRCFSVTSKTLADHVRIVEVGPRDGLQNEKSSISPETKIDLVRRLAATGLKTIEAGSFVHPKWTPQMASSDKVLQNILQQPPQTTQPITYQWLLPNMKGLDNFFSIQAQHSTQGDTFYPTPPQTPMHESSPAQNTSTQNPNDMPSATSGAAAMDSRSSPEQPKHEVSIFLSATESFSQKNTNCSIAESLERFQPLITSARDKGFGVRAYISVALGCPFEGPDVDPHKVAELAASLLEMGADEISVADTTGMGTAPRTRELLRTLTAAGIRNDDLALHFHDTFGQAMVNTLVGLEHGIRTFDSAVGGLGGCPYSPGATGNVATEDLVHTLESLGVNTGIDMSEISRIGDWITSEIGKPNESRAGKATLAKLRRTTE
ncbi:hydroxymethylglutaryl-CoA lyase [Aureobasidium sp. EXF-3400]|nr:hydroxymethylglutaryl-CoA lyase [Aureobasidium sp. EXF-12344]KAI4775459.1 hydroxymethylglutaryl-CoA lyase [Aureobasidium sp. EXF-3400]